MHYSYHLSSVIAEKSYVQISHFSYIQIIDALINY